MIIIVCEFPDVYGVGSAVEFNQTNKLLNTFTAGVQDIRTLKSRIELLFLPHFATP